MNENLTPELQSMNEKPQNVEQELQTNQSVKSQPIDELTKETIVEELKAMSNQEDVPPRAEVDALKQAFYKLRLAEIDALKAKFVEDGGVEEDFLAGTDALEEEAKVLFNAIKDKRAKAIAEGEKEKEDNLAKKLAIIDSIKTLNESSDDFGKVYKDFKELQQKWNEIKLVPQASANDLWKSYQIQTEKFYDLLKINNEFRDYDFKKNLELKTALCEAVEKLQEEGDVISSFHQLQNFHQQWREIGPVAKELRDDLWARFKLASTEINKKYQSHFESLKASEEENLVAKKEICEAIKAIDYATLTSYKEWDDKSKEVIELQAKWKTIGFVPRKMNTAIFEEFRGACDEFFEKKSEFFKSQKDEMQENLEKKRTLCEKAKALKDSTDWRKTTDELIAIQREWKAIGPVPRKYSDVLWKEFVSACDHFFEQKKTSTSSQKEEEVANLNLKKELIAKINELDVALEAKEAVAKLREYMNEWHAIGFVPFRDKDKIYKEYQSALDAHFDRLKVNKSERRFNDFKTNLEDISKLDRPKEKILNERDRLMYQFNKVKADLQTYENNMGFLSVSKGGGGLLKDMNNKIEDLKNELGLIVKKIETIDENLKTL